jgi:hypothetical protein
VTASEFVYTYATIRNVVNEHDNQIREGKPAKTKKRFGFIPGKDKPLVNFDTPALVITKQGAQEQDRNLSLKYPITAAAIKSFLERNRNLLKEDSGGDIQFQDDEKKRAKPSSDFDALSCEKGMAVLSQFDGDLLDYDDRLSTEDGIVYGITINR